MMHKAPSPLLKLVLSYYGNDMDKLFIDLKTTLKGFRRNVIKIKDLEIEVFTSGWNLSPSPVKNQNNAGSEDA